MGKELIQHIINKLTKNKIKEGISIHLEILKDTNNFWNVYLTLEGKEKTQEEFGVLEYDEDFALFINNLLEINLSNKEE